MKKEKEYSITVNKDDDTPKRINEVIKGLGLDHFKSMKEFLDNSIQAGATRIRVFLKNNENVRSIVIRDNGLGISEDRYISVGRYGALKEEKLKAQNEESLGQNQIGTKAALTHIANSGHYVTVVEKSEPVILFPQPDRVKVKTVIVSDVDKEEVKEIGDHGTSIILTDLKMTHEEFDRLKVELGDQLGMYYQKLMTVKTGRLHIWVDGDEIEPFDPLMPTPADNRVSKDNEVQPLFEELVELSISNEQSVKAKVWASYVPPKKALRAEGRVDLAEKYYPRFLKDGYGLFISRNGRLISILPTNLINKMGARMNSFRLWVDFSSKDASFMFDGSAIRKEVDLPRKLLADLCEKLDEPIRASVAARERAVERLGIVRGASRGVTVGMVQTAIDKVRKNYLIENPDMEESIDKFSVGILDVLKDLKKSDPKVTAKKVVKKAKKNKKEELVHA